MPNPFRRSWLIFTIRLLAIAALTLTFAGTPRAAGAISTKCYVWQAAPGINDGSSWDDAYTSLQSALTNITCNQIWVAKGVYKPTSTSDRTVSFVVLDTVQMYGGFKGTETLVTERDPWKNRTILSGDIDSNDVNLDGNRINERASQIRGENSYHVVMMDGTFTPITSPTVLDGFTVTGGDADGGAPITFGGGLLCKGQGGTCSPTLRGMTFSGNRALYAGAILNDGHGGGVSSPNISGSTFVGNEATFGGAVFNNGYQGTSSPTIENSTFHGNIAYEGTAIWDSGSGGGFAQGSYRNLTVEGNSTTAVGAAIYGTDDDATGAQCAPTLVNVIVWDNDTGGGSQITGFNCAYTVSYSIVQGGYPGTGNLNVDPLLKSFGFNGGVNQTMPLKYGSPAVNAGTNTGCPATDQRGIARPVGDTCDMGATESPLKSMTFRSQGTKDGWVLETAENDDKGGNKNAGAGTIRVGDDAADRQYRSILSFDSAGLPDAAVVEQITLRIKDTGPLGGDLSSFGLGSLWGYFKNPKIGTQPSLQSGDFQADVPTAFETFADASVDGWYVCVSFDDSTFGELNHKGLTQFRLEFAMGDNDNAAADILQVFSGDALKAKRPQLIVQYYVP